MKILYCLTSTEKTGVERPAGRTGLFNVPKPAPEKQTVVEFQHMSGHKALPARGEIALF